MFRGYADHMETEEFREGIERLLGLARESRTAIMCAEARLVEMSPQLNRGLFKSEGRYGASHCWREGKSEEHPFTSAARIVKGELSYRGVLDVSE